VNRPRWTDGLLPGAAGVIGFSGTVPATRVAAPVLGPVTLTAARILIAAALGAVTLVIIGRRRWPGRRHLVSLLVMGSGLAVGYPLFLALAVERVPASHAAVDIALVPAATAALSAVRNSERQSPLFWAACLAGMAAVTGYALISGGGTVRAGDLWLAAAVLACAAGYVEGARVARSIGAVPALCWAMLLLVPIAVPLLLVGALTRPASPIPASAWVGLGYAGVVSMFAASLAWYRGLAIGGTARIGQLNLAQPFLSIAWSALLLGEQIPPAAPVTAAIVFCCMAVCLRTARKQALRAVLRLDPQRPAPSMSHRWCYGNVSEQSEFSACRRGRAIWCGITPLFRPADAHLFEMIMVSAALPRQECG
jgi:drug/metabolite transporter (DMT)-like permease